MFYGDSMKNVLILFLIMCLFGCLGQPPHITEKVSVYKQVHTVNLSNSLLVKKLLLDQHAEWKGTRYQLGGLSKKGIDCSGFIFVTFKSKLGLAIPRSTELQVKEGVEVSREKLRVGDLVFFKTGLFVRHVGVYLGDSEFLHASKSVGVIISSLKNDYWSSNYWVSKRM